MFLPSKQNWWCLHTFGITGKGGGCCYWPGLSAEWVLKHKQEDGAMRSEEVKISIPLGGIGTKEWKKQNLPKRKILNK